MKKNNTQKHNCIYQVNNGGYYYCKIVIDREKAMNEKYDDVKYGGVIEHLDARCIKKRGCGFKK